MKLSGLGADPLAKQTSIISAERPSKKEAELMVQHLNAAVRETFDEPAPEIRCVRRRRRRLFRKVEIVQHLIVQLRTARQAMPFTQRG